MTNFSRIALAAFVASTFALPVLAQPSTTAAPGATSGAASVPSDPTLAGKTATSKTTAGKTMLPKPAVNTGIHRAATTETKPAAAATDTKAITAAKPTPEAKPTDVKKPVVAAAPVAPVTTGGTGASSGGTGATTPKPAK